MRIAQLAQAAGMSINTIRYYEKFGLLDDSHYRRLPNGYREYNETALARLALIRRGQAGGLTLAEMRDGIHDWEADRFSNQEKRDYFVAKLAQLEARIHELQEIRAYVLRKIEYFDELAQHDAETPTVS